MQAKIAGPADIGENAARAASPAPSSSGQLIAFCAALTAAFSPRRRSGSHHRVAHAGHDRADIGEIAIHQARRGDDVADALHGLAQHVVGDAERFKEAVVPLGTRLSSWSLGMVMTVSTTPANSANPSSACRRRLGPSNANGFVTTATVSAPSSFARRRDYRSPHPMPVPPPNPAVTKTMSAPSRDSMIFSVSSSRGLPAHRWIRDRAQTVRHLRADGQLIRNR